MKLPEGYVAYPEIGSAYKVYDQNVTWPEAGASCLQEQAKLALIDSAEKLEYVKRQKLSGNWAHVGIIRILADHIWFAPYKGGTCIHLTTRSVDDITNTYLNSSHIGMKLMESSLPWLDGAPSYSGDMDCVAIDFEGNGLGNYHCFSEANYVCEISLSQKETTIKQANQAFGPYSKFLG